MKNNRWIVLGMIACMSVIVLSYLWATGIMDSLYGFRSPLASNPPAATQALGQPHTRRVLLILVDALRLDTSLNAEVMPFLNELRAQGASASMHSRVPSFSAPGYSVLMTGAWPDVSDGPAMNPLGEEMPRTWTQDNLFSAAHRAGLRTAVSGYDWFKGLIPQDTVDASFYTHGEDAAADRDVVDAALPWLTGDYQLILIHIDQVDYAGHHQGGPQSPNWAAAASRADGLIRELASKLDLGQDTVIVFSDHGQIDRGGHGGQDPIVLLEPFVMAGAGIKPDKYNDMNMVDVAPTVAALLGTNIPAANQGNVLTDLLDLTPEQKNNISSTLGSQQGALFTAYTRAIGRPGDVTKIRVLTVDTVQAEMSAAKMSRVNAERIPRFILVAALLLMVGFFARRNWSGLLTKISIAALGYVALFNFAYVILLKRTYSLSSIGGVEDILLVVGLLAALSFLIVWSILAYGLKLNKMVARQAVETSLTLTFITLFLLALPFLWSYAYNGLLITWTLPDMASMFMAFLSTLQALIVAAIGLLFAGAAALLASKTQKQ